ncbi:MAG: ABC transporter permease [Longimicrobiales bacterium]
MDRASARPVARRGTLWLDAFAADTRFALRHFARRPITTLVMFIILASGITISSLLFSWVQSLAFQPPAAIALRDDLVRIRGIDGYPDEQGFRRLSEDEFEAYRSLSQFSTVAGWIEGEGTFLGPDDTDARVLQQAPDQLPGGAISTSGAVKSRISFVTDNYFDALGLQMAAGPGLPKGRSGDAANSAVAVIDYYTWQQLFAKSREAIGTTIILNGVAVTIVGVAPVRFSGIQAQTGLQVWMPVSARALIAPRTGVDYIAFGRLRPGVTAQAATSAVQTIALNGPGMTDEMRREVKPSADVAQMLSANIDPSFDDMVLILFAMLGGLATVILLVTCTNVSALLTGLASARRQEIAIRLSLGAARGRIIRQLLTESAVLAVLAGAAALGLVMLVMKTALALLPPLPFTVGITWSLTGFTFIVALTVGIAFGLSPALHATRMALASVLRDSSRGVGTRGRLQKSLVIAQIAFTQPLIVGLAGFLLLVLGTMQPATLSDAADRVITISVAPTSNTNQSDEELRALMNRVLQQLQTTPGVEKAVIDWSGSVPLGKYIAESARAANAVVDISTKLVAEDYFSVLNVPVTRGRTFSWADVASVTISKVDIPIIIGTDLAAHLWGGADAIGRRMTSAYDTTTNMRSFVVVGVVDDPVARTRAPSERWATYVITNEHGVPQKLLLRTTSPAKAFLPTIRGVVNRAAPGAVTAVSTLADIEATDRRNLRLASGSVFVAGAIALLLAAIGLYAVVAFSVSQRTHEIAVRLAVGARGNQIARKFVIDGIKLSGIGMAIGLPLSLLGLRALMKTSETYDVQLTPVALIAAASVLVVAAAAAWIPARRAASVDPADVLRGG